MTSDFGCPCSASSLVVSKQDLTIPISIALRINAHASLQQKIQASRTESVMHSGPRNPVGPRVGDGSLVAIKDDRVRLFRNKGMFGKSLGDSHDSQTLGIGKARQVEFASASLRLLIKHPIADSPLPMTKRPYQICAQCVMDTTDSKIRFDAQGVCDHCVTFREKILPNWHTDQRGRSEIDRIADAIRSEGKGKDFDCIIGMSGGIDSSYLTYLAKEELGLRPLVFHVDAGWNSQEAVNNIERIVDHLGLDLFTDVIDWEEIKDLQLAFFKSGVSHIDTPQDHAFFATMYKFAEKYKVRHILTGANYSTECVRNPIEWMYYQSDSVQLLDIHRQFGSRPLVNFPVTSILRHKVYLKYIKRIGVLAPLNYLPYVKSEAMKLLQDKFGWQPYPQKHFESRFTRFYEGYWLPEKFGYDVRRVQFSSLILTGQMTRAEAITRLKSPALDASTIAQETAFVAAKLGISVEELIGYLHAPNRTFRDYRSQDNIYAVGARLMRILGLELGGKR